MLIDNIDSIPTSKVYKCEDVGLKNFLCKTKNIPLLGIRTNNNNGSQIWYFSKTKALTSAVAEWIQNIQV